LFRKNIGKVITPVLLISLGLIGIGSVIYSTRVGPYLTGDSIVYMQGAKNILAGNGYSTLLGRGEVVPIIGFPPLTSVSLAMTNWGLGNMAQTGRWLNAILFGVNIVLAGLIVYRYSRAVVPAVLAAAMIVSHPTMMAVHSAIMSEGLFIFLLLLTLWVFAEYFWRGRVWLLVMGGILSALCFLTRYVGIILIPAMGLGLLLFGRQSWKNRFGAILVFGLVSLIPVIMWFLRNQSISGNLFDRQTGLHLMPQAMRGILGDTILSWFYLTKLGLAWRIRVLAFGVLFGLLLVWSGWSIYNSKNEGAEDNAGGYQFPALLAVVFLSYIALIWINTSVLDASTSKGAIVRYLAPLFVSTVVLLTCLASSIASHQKGPAVKVLFTALGVLLVGYYTSGSFTYLTQGGEYGNGYTDFINDWTDDIALLKQLDPSHPIVTNDTQLLFALSNRYSYGLPPAGDITPGVDDKKLYTELSPDGFLVIIIRGDNTLSNLLPEAIQERLVLYNQSTHIRIYVLPNFTP
jgi:hypothetical protein